MEPPEGAYAEVRATIERMLDSNREALIDCVLGLEADAPRHHAVSSETTLLGLIKHAAAVERLWFQERLAGLPPSKWDGSTDDVEAWRLGPEDSVDSAIADFRRASQRSREIVSDFALHEGYESPSHGFVSVRWILLHMIE
ncbi:MAG: DUF664 domain-containing protein, partial [Nocardioides sp.]